MKKPGNFNGIRTHNLCGAMIFQVSMRELIIAEIV